MTKVIRKKISETLKLLTTLTGMQYGLHIEKDNYYIFDGQTGNVIIRAASPNGLQMKLYALYLNSF